MKRTTDLTTLAVDFDGTLAETVWTQESPFAMGPPIERVVRRLREMQEEWRIVIHTSRSWADYFRIVAWLQRHDVPYDDIVCEKLLAAAYIDDRALNPHCETCFERMTAQEKGEEDDPVQRGVGKG